MPPVSGGRSEFTVVVTQPGTALRLVYSCDGEATAGRDAAAQIHLPHPLVSRQHARIGYDGATFTVEDLGSRNGTTIAGQPVHGIHADPGPLAVEIGPFVLALDSQYSEETWTATGLAAAPPRSFLDSGTRQLHVDGALALETLSTHEYAFLSALHRAAPNVVARSVAGDAVWGEGQWDVYMLHNLVSRLRRRIAAGGADDGVVVTVPGVGYRLE